MKHSYSILTSLFFTWLIWGPIIVNSQPGDKFVLFGIDWKADNLDNTMFWWGIVFSLLGAGSASYMENRQDKKEKYRYGNQI